MSDTVAIGAEAVANMWLYGAVLLSVGLIAVRWWLQASVRNSLSASLVDQIERSLAQLGLRLGLLVVAAFIARGWTHTLALFGWEGATSPSRLQVVLGRSIWGKAWQYQMIVAAAFAVAALVVHRTRRGGAWWLLTGWGLGLCGVLPLIGHSAGSPFREALHGLHLFGSGLWLGTLIVVLIVSRSKTNPEGRPITSQEVARSFLSRFSPLAVTGISTLAFGGVGAAYQYFNAFSDLWTTTYGQLLSAKILLFAAAGFCGWLNWRAFRKNAAPSHGHFRPVAVEVGLALAIILITSLFTEIDHPLMDME